MNKISVAVVDDNEKIVETICNELERDEEINIVGKAYIETSDFAKELLKVN